MERLPGMDSYVPRWLRVALFAASCTGVATGFWFFSVQHAERVAVPLAGMAAVSSVLLATAAAITVLVAATLIALMCGWRPSGWGESGPDDDGGGGGGGDDPRFPPGPPPGLGWSDFDRLRDEWEAEAGSRRPALSR